VPVGYSYTRFSHRAQAGGDSIRRQLAKAEEWAAENGVELDTTLRDEGVSAFKGENRVRGALASFLTRLEAGQIARGSYLIIEQFDRLSRATETEAINLLTGITLKGVKVVTLHNKAVYDEKSDGMDLMRAIIEMGAAHTENKSRASRVRSAWEARKDRARDGEIVTRLGPRWLRYDHGTKMFAPIPERVAVVERIFSECLSGMGSSAIAARLNAGGIPSFSESAGWHSRYVMAILHNRAVYGAYQPTRCDQGTDFKRQRVNDGDLIEGYYPAIIAYDVWLRAQAVIAKRNKRGGGKGRRGKMFPNLIIGLGRCEECGGALTVANAYRSSVVRALRCYGALRQHNCGNRRRYLCREIEDHLSEFILRVKETDVEAAPERATLAARVAERMDLRAKIAALVDQLELGSTAVAERLRQREAEVVALDREIERLTAEAMAPQPNRDALAAALSWLRTVEGEGDPSDVYAARAKANALLTEAYGWVMPMSADDEGGVRGVIVGGDNQAWLMTDEVLIEYEIDPINRPTRAWVEAGRFVTASMV